MSRSRFKLVPVALAAAFSFSTPTSNTALAQTAPSATSQAAHGVNVSAQPLGDALNELARQAGLQLLVQRELVAGKFAPAVNGTLSARQALDQLLAGSGLVAIVDGQSVVVRHAPAPDASSSAETTLPAVRVTAIDDRPLPARQERGYRSKRSSVSGFREQEVLNTPFSTATISAEIMEDQQAKSLIDVVKNDPSVTPADDPLWFDRVNVRGFYLSVDAIYRDGLSINDQGSIALENKAAVEVNKGLSALRYGATSPGGTVNYAVKRPTNLQLRKVSLNADSNGGFGAHADLGDRFGAERQFGYRINAAASELRSHVKPFKGDKQFLSGFFDWRVNDQLTLEFDVEHQRVDKLSVKQPNLRWWGSVQDALAAFSSLEPESYAFQSWAMEPNEQTYLVARATYQFSGQWKATVSAHRSSLQRDQNSGGVNSGSVLPGGEYDASIYYAPNQERNNKAYQIVFQGDVDLGALRHELAFGYDQLQRDMSYPEGVSRVFGSDNLFNPRGVLRPSDGPSEAGPSYIANRTHQQSWFLTDNVIISDQWRIFGGLRYTSIKQSTAASASEALATRYNKSKLNPTLGLVFKPVPVGTVYASYAEGIEQGGVVDNDESIYTNPGEQLPPLTSKQYEAGIKWELGRDALVTAALFEIQKGLERDRSNGVNTPRTRVQDGLQVHRGFELTVSGQLTSNLKLIGGVAYLDAHIERTGTPSLIGKRPQGVPDWQANLYADYALSSWVPGLSVNGGLYYGGKKAVDANNLWMADSHVRLDAGVKYMHKLADGQEATYRLSFDNIADKRYLASTSGGSLQFGAPRTVRVSGSFNF